MMLDIFDAGWQFIANFIIYATSFLIENICSLEAEKMIVFTYLILIRSLSKTYPNLHNHL